MVFVSALLILSLALLSFAGQQQQPLDTGRKKTYNVTLDFDNIRTPPSGIGFHPHVPHDPPIQYKSLFLQSFTLVNTSTAEIPLADKLCAKSQPNAIFASRKDGFAWPRISAYDLTKPVSDERESGGGKRTFSLLSLWLRLTGNITGPPDRTVSAVSLTMLRLNPNPIAAPAPEFRAGYPGVFRGAPLPVNVGHVSYLTVLGGVGVQRGLKVDVRRLFGGRVGSGVDVLEVVGQVLRWDEGKPGGWQREDWEVCLDDVEVEVVEGVREDGEGKQEVEMEEGPKVLGVKADGTEVRVGDWEWDVMREMVGF